jgi:hypothetical protein
MTPGELAIAAFFLGLVFALCCAAWRHYRHTSVVSPRVREASHALNNEVQKLHATKSKDVLRGLVDDIRGGGDDRRRADP